MASNRALTKTTNLPVPSREGGRILMHQYFVPNYKAKIKSRASALTMEFLSKVFASDGNSRFFKTFLLRFLFDSSGKSSEDCSGTPAFA